MALTSELGAKWGEMRDASGMHVPFRKILQALAGIDVEDVAGRTTLRTQAVWTLKRLGVWPKTISQNGRLYADPLFSRPRWQASGADMVMPKLLVGYFWWGSQTFPTKEPRYTDMTNAGIEPNMLAVVSWGSSAVGEFARTNNITVTASNPRSVPGSIRFTIVNHGSTTTWNPLLSWAALRVGGPTT